MIWYAALAIAFTDVCNGIENESTCALLDTSETQIAIRESRTYSDRQVVWTQTAMMARTNVVWRREAAEGGG